MTTQVKRIRVKWRDDDSATFEAGSYTDAQARAMQVYIDRREGKVFDLAYTNEGTDDHAAQVMEAALGEEDKPEAEPMAIAGGFTKCRERGTYHYYVSDNYSNGLGEAWDVSDQTWADAAPLFARFEITPDLDVRERHYWMNLVYLCQEYARAEALNNGEWRYLGCQAIAETDGDVTEEGDDESHVFAESAGLWNVESDCSDADKREIMNEQIDELRHTLRECGIDCPPDVEVVIDE